MKKIYVLLSMALFGLASCSEVFEKDNESQVSVIQANLGQSDNTTRVAFTPDRSMVWSTGDKLYVFNTSKTTMFTYTLNSGAGTASGTFTGTPTAGFTSGYAILAETEPTSLTSGNVLKLNLPTSYDYVSGKHPIPMWGTVTDGTVSLKHMMGYLKVTYNNMPAAAQHLKVEADKVIAGGFEATLTDADPTLVATSGNTDNNSFTYNFTAAEGSSMTFYVPIPVGTYDKIKLTLQNGSNEDLASISFLNRTVARTMIYSINLNYTASEEIVIPVESTATTEEGLAGEIQAAINNAAANSKVIINVGNTITADATNKVAIPVSSGKKVDVELNFTAAPTTTESTPLDFVDKDNSSVSSGAAINTVKITMPGGSTIAKMNVEMPYSTVTLLSSNSTDVTYTSLTQKTATSTLVVEENVKISAIADASGNSGKISVEGGEVTVAASSTVAAIEVKEGSVTVPSGTTVTALTVVENTETTATAPTVTVEGTVTDLTVNNEDAKVDTSAGTVTNTPTTGVKGVKVVDSVDKTNYYGSVSTALADGVKEVTLLGDIDSDMLSAITTDLTLNLNGKTLTLKGNSAYNNWTNQCWYPAVYINGSSAINLVINGGTSSESTENRGKIVLGYPCYTGIYSNKGNLTLNYADIEFSESNGFTAANAGILFWYDAGDLTINGGEINFGSKPSYGIDFEGGKLAIDGTTFTSTATHGNTVIYTEVSQDATIKDVTINSVALGGIYASGSKTQNKTSKVTVQNSTITISGTNTNGYTWMSSALAASHGSELTVESGTYSAQVAAAYVFSSGGTINLKAGSYTGTTNCLRVDRSASELTESSVGSYIYYASGCTQSGTNATNISSGYNGKIEEKSF